MRSMKRGILSIMMFSIVSSFYSQNYYRCNTDSIAVLVAPGEGCDTFFIATPYYNCEEGPVFISKGFVFMSKDVSEEGYTKIYNHFNTLCWDEGWIPSTCLSPALKCPQCKGKGTMGKKCAKCNGDGDWDCCQYKGLEICDKCKGIGYY